MSDPVDAALAYAIWDSENSVRIAAASIDEHLERAKALRRWLRFHGHDVKELND